VSLFPRFAAVLCTTALTVVATAAWGAGTPAFGSRPPPPPEADGLTATRSVGDAPSGFDTLRKPPIPVSFLSEDRGWIQIWYPPSARDRVAPLIAQADDLRAELAEALAQTPLEGVEVRVAREYEIGTLAPQDRPVASDAARVSYPKLKLIVLSLGAGPGEPAELAESFRHELARLAFMEAVGDHAAPAWIAEGFALHFSGEAQRSRDWALWRASVRRQTYATSELDRALEASDSRAPLASAQAADMVSFLLRPEMHSKFGALVERLRQGDSVESALSSAYGLGLGVIERQWRTELGRRTTVSSILMGIGFPAACLVAYAVVRMMRRRRASMVGKRPIKKEGRPASGDRPRVHIVFSRRDDRVEPPMLPESEIPKVEHEGEWHTLH
jgi:hypothetical protein